MLVFFWQHMSVARVIIAGSKQEISVGLNMVSDVDFYAKYSSLTF